MNKLHDPERNAAGYLAGEMPQRRRRRFEGHLLDCEDCWTEVNLGRAGRALAESARELAPPFLRDGVRAAVSLSPQASRGWFVPAAIMIPLLVAAVAAGFLLTSGSQPRPIAAALASYRAGSMPGNEPAAANPPDLSADGLRFAASSHGDLGGMTVDAFEYRDSSGRRLMVFASSSSFPTARGAMGMSSQGWRSTDGGEVLLCPDTAGQFLLVTSDRSLAADAAREFA